MATALVDITIPDVTNADLENIIGRVEALLKPTFPAVEVELNADTEYDEEDDDDED